MGYHFNQTRSFLQIFVSMPTIVPKARGLLERGFSFGSFPSHEYQCFEANIPFTLRYMIDADIPGCCWLEAPSRSYSVRHGYKKVSSCQIEIDIVFDSIVVHPPELEWQRIAPLRVLSFDIECQVRAYPPIVLTPGWSGCLRGKASRECRRLDSLCMRCWCGWRCRYTGA